MSEAAQKLSLAPAAGAGIGKQIADSLLAQPDFIQEMTKTARDGLRAMSPRRWDKESQKWVADPDMRTRAQMFFGLLAHMEGEPIKRIIHQHLGQGGKIDVSAALADSPELQAVVERELHKAQWRTSGNQPHKRPKRAEPVVEGEAGPAV
jgi:hypothetical protein